MSTRIGNEINLYEALDETDYDDREFKRGEIYYIDLEDTSYGTKYLQTKTRPGLIIQNDVGNNKGATLIVALLTTKFKKPYPFQCKVTIGDRESVIMFEQIMTIDKFRVLSKMGELTYQQMKEAEAALTYSLGLNRLNLENITDIDAESMIIEKTKYKESIYFVLNLFFGNFKKSVIKAPLETLQEYDTSITKDMDLDNLRNLFDCCKGLNWLARNFEI